MFFSRTHNTPSSQAMIGSESTNSRTALEQALGSAKKQDDKMAVVGELVDMKVDGPTRLDFSEQVGDILSNFCRVVGGWGGCGKGVVGELVDMKVDGPTRLDFSEQVGDILSNFCRVVGGWGGCGMAVVGELVDMKVDGPTRLDFSEQVGDILAKFCRVVGGWGGMWDGCGW